MRIPYVSRLGDIDDFRAIKRMMIEDTTIFNLFAPPMDYMDLLNASVATFEIEDDDNDGGEIIKKKKIKKNEKNDDDLLGGNLFGGDDDSETTVD